jgi:hypothetical protein
MIGFKIFVFFLFFGIAPSYCGAFDLHVTATAPGRTWNDGVLEVEVGDTVSFSMTASGGAGPYAYEWDFGDFGYYKERYADRLKTNYTAKDPTWIFNYPGRYDVKVLVTDTGAGNATETSLVSIMVFTALRPVYAATAAIENDPKSRWNGKYAGNCGAAGDGLADDTKAIQKCMNGLNRGGIIDLGGSNYTYKIVGAINRNSSKGPKERNVGLFVQDNLITFWGHGAKINYDHSNDLDRGGTNSTDYFLCFAKKSEKKIFFYKVNFQYIVPGDKQNHEMDRQAFATSGGSVGSLGYLIVQDSTIDGFSGLSGNAYYHMIRNNIINWGNGHDKWNKITRAAMLKSSGNTLLLLNYSLPIVSARANTSHFHYIQKDYSFTFYNFHYAADSSGNATLFKIYGRNANFRHHYIQGNYLEGAKWGLGNLEISGGYIAGPIHVTNNYLINFKSSCNSAWIWMGRTASANYVDIVWSGNHISNDACASGHKAWGFYCGDRSWYCRGQRSCDSGCSYKYGDITIQNNQYGDGFDGVSWDINDESSKYFQWGLPSGRSHQDVRVMVSGNSVGKIDYQSSTRGGSGPADPGCWEFAPPTNNGDSASDNGQKVCGRLKTSGMGSTARWPFKQGALAQGVSADGQTFSEVHVYQERQKINEPKIRYADVHHNWSGLADFIGRTDVQKVKAAGLKYSP